MLDLRQLYDTVVKGDAQTSRALTAQALAEGVDPLKLVNEFLVPAMDDLSTSQTHGRINSAFGFRIR
jgi:methanogenic corrinoid protein MtbC1